MCPGINIFGNIYNIDAPIGTSNGKLLTFNLFEIRHFSQGEKSKGDAIVFACVIETKILLCISYCNKKWSMTIGH